MSFRCLTPRLAVQRKEGEKPIFLHHEDYEFFLKAYSGDKFSKVLLIPCGSCPNCIKRRSQEWTSRLLLESKKHKYSYFITLTYDDEHLTEINKRDIQLFLKRYRKKYDLELKYYVCGEHGETTSRSHYHAVFFQDKEIPGLEFYANNLYISKEFASVWSLGNCLISKQVNERSIKYTIAYTLKKLGEEKIVLMSKGIGLDYFKDNKKALMDHNGFYIQNGFKQPLPPYFLRKLKASSDIDDINFLQARKDEPQGSTLLSGDTINNLHAVYDEEVKKRSFKGKGIF